MYLPDVHELRADLARLCGDLPIANSEIEEACRLHAAMGATLQVERLAREAGT